MTFHHFGIACENIGKTINLLQDDFEIKEISEIIYDELQNCNLCLLTLNDGTIIELVSGEVVKAIIKRNIYLYHTCWSVDNIDEVFLNFSKKFSTISSLKPAKLFNNKRVCFFQSDIGIIELLEN